MKKIILSFVFCSILLTSCAESGEDKSSSSAEPKTQSVSQSETTATKDTETVISNDPQNEEQSLAENSSNTDIYEAYLRLTELSADNDDILDIIYGYPMDNKVYIAAEIGTPYENITKLIDEAGLDMESSYIHYKEGEKIDTDTQYDKYSEEELAEAYEKYFSGTAYTELCKTYPLYEIAVRNKHKIIEVTAQPSFDIESFYSYAEEHGLNKDMFVFYLCQYETHTT